KGAARVRPRMKMLIIRRIRTSPFFYGKSNRRARVRVLPALPSEVADHRFRVLNAAVRDHIRDLLAGEPADLDLLVVHRSGFAFGKILGQVDGHPLFHIAGADPEGGEPGPAAGLVSGLLGEIPVGGFG